MFKTLLEERKALNCERCLDHSDKEFIRNKGHCLNIYYNLIIENNRYAFFVPISSNFLPEYCFKYSILKIYFS